MADDVETYLRSEHADAAELALWVREHVRRADRDLAERVYRGWRGIGFRHPDAGFVCAIYPKDERVELLFEHGMALSDPERVLQGSGTQTRVIEIEQADDALGETIEHYVQQAIAQRLLDRGV